MKLTKSNYCPIFTKWLAPTDTKGSRVKAYDAGRGGRSITVHWDHTLNIFDNHARAARALAEKLGWEDDYLAASHERGYIFTRIPKVNE